MDGHGFDAERSHVAGGLLSGLIINIGDRNICSFTGKGKRNGSANALP
jgi:hypothetical protein